MSQDKGKILVVDDEEALAQLIEYALSREHDVVIATRAERGLERLLGGEDFDLVFCDLVMPGMSGIEFYQKSTQTRPEIKDRVIFMSGGAVTSETRRFVSGLAADRLVEKPFSLKTIRELVGNRLAKPGA